MLGIQPRGVVFAKRLKEIFSEMFPGIHLPYGDLDVTFFRDDYRMHKNPILPNATKINFVIEGKSVILVDDVLYTGRTVRSALDAMLAFGRPEKVELVILVDRSRMRDLPIQSDYKGIKVDTHSGERVIVSWKETLGKDAVWIEKS
jgi:pyrimidine operon attenuation protein/uracil phosphoribosyltransferase